MTRRIAKIKNRIPVKRPVCRLSSRGEWKRGLAPGCLSRVVIDTLVCARRFDEADEFYERVYAIRVRNIDEEYKKRLLLATEYVDIR